ncbi:nitrogen fixation protein NifU [Desemzia incerta]|uniref:Nitrogen fixation protein NifU n=1 Tax=Desemzia incerta TaxID=82801 RepID=A0A1I5XS15_9LACT|nr:SUF system NifU family Fe-S cluster assembly protein [Desemzia incerta]SFQ34606.1 nitrogen fixation protein NifU [Desemzia incerta]
MGLSKLDQLYRQVILDHSQHPHHYGKLDESTRTIELNNPTCGDVIQLHFLIEDDRITDIRFSGHGCTISKASASMMTDLMVGKTLEEALQLEKQFSLLVQGEEVQDVEELGDAVLLSGVAKFPARIKCATLSWKALEKALAE